MASPDSDNPTSVFDSKLESILELLEEEDSQHFIYLTGAAGTGKTTLIERVKDECLLRKMVVASTGVAALNIGGSTINSAFRIGFDTFPNIQESKDPRFKKLLKKLELLIIDEISMVRAPMLDAISETLKIHRNSSEPFGGIHVLACGDLFQFHETVSRPLTETSGCLSGRFFRKLDISQNGSQTSYGPLRTPSSRPPSQPSFLIFFVFAPLTLSLINKPTLPRAGMPVVDCLGC